MNKTVSPIQQHAMTGAAKLFAFAYLVAYLWLYYSWHVLVLELAPRRYVIYLARLLRLLVVLLPNKVMRINGTYKFEIYMPAFPTPAFFHAMKKYDPATRDPGCLTVVFSMTKACAYKCPHCYQRLDQGKEVEIERLKAVAREMQDLGTASFDIEGGEPMLRFERLCELLSAFDERAEVWVNTTGHMLTRDKAERLRELGVFGSFVSLHSSDPATYEKFTGIEGSFDAACNGIRMLQEVGIATAINYCASAEDVQGDGVHKLIAKARELNCAFVQVIHPKAAGGWLEKRDGMVTESELIGRLSRIHLDYNKGTKRRAFPALTVQVFEESPSEFGCTAGGVDRFYLNHEGEVQPCEFINVSFGNVNDEPFAEIFRRMRSSFATPGTAWLCCTEAESIAKLYKAEGLDKTPLPRRHTEALVAGWDKGAPTKLYRDLGIYRPRPGKSGGKA